MDADSQARGGRGGRSGGVPNYRNDILIEVVDLYLPEGLEEWRAVALSYQRESMETVHYGSHPMNGILLFVSYQSIEIMYHVSYNLIYYFYSINTILFIS